MNETEPRSQPCLSASLCPELQLKSAELNQTLSRRDGTQDKSLEEMKAEIHDMLDQMRKLQFGGKKITAEEELEYEHTLSPHTHSLYLLP